MFLFDSIFNGADLLFYIGALAAAREAPNLLSNPETKPGFAPASSQSCSSRRLAILYPT